jgi:hypothetical protein
MMTITVKGQLDEEGQVRVELPANFIPGEVEITLRVADEAADDDDAELWSDDELRALIQPSPKSGAEIAKSDAIGGWAHLGITDSAEWVAQLRHLRSRDRAK